VTPANTLPVGAVEGITIMLLGETFWTDATCKAEDDIQA
jgi:hypothetical protein